MPSVSYAQGELDLQYIDRGKYWYLRLTSPVRRNGVKLFVQKPLRQDAPSSVWLTTFKLLYQGLVGLQRRESK